MSANRQMSIVIVEILLQTCEIYFIVRGGKGHIRHLVDRMLSEMFLGDNRYAQT